jgi:heme-degrading monooxygenase HmoA
MNRLVPRMTLAGRKPRAGVSEIEFLLVNFFRHQKVIVRIFRAAIREGRCSDFEQMVKEQSVPWLEKSDGMLGCFPGKPLAEGDREFVMISLWRDLDALRAFVGEEWDSPVVTEDELPLVDQMTVDHYFAIE